MVRFSLLFASLAACKFSASAASDAPHANDSPVDSRTIDASIDAPPPPACTARSATCLDDVTLSTCAGLNATPVVTKCNWGCIATGTAHCGQLAAHGGGVNSGDFTAQGGAPLTLNNAKLNTNDGTIMGVTTGFSAVLRGNVMVFRFSGLTLTGTTQFTGPNAAAFVADGAITINAIVDVRGPCAMNAKNAGPGGFNGGNGDAPGMGMGGGAAINSKDCGGAGGGYGGQGGNGGGPSTAIGGGTYGDAFISVLVGGSGGGGGHNTGHVGGGGGGALQLASNTSVTISNSGGINAGGCGGLSANSDGNGGGGGGGAGGAILIEAPVVSIDGVLAVNGGAGGGFSFDGAAGTLDRTAATDGNETGGDGGAAATPDGHAGSDPGGGGGGVGRIRLESRTGTVQVTGTMSPALQDPGTTATAGAANVL